MRDRALIEACASDKASRPEARAVDARGAAHLEPRRLRRAFSMIELVTVLAVTVLVTSMLFPAISQVRENLNRVLCASNARQFGLGTVMYAKDNRNRLMPSAALQPERILRLKQLRTARLETEGWDGLGLLFRLGYCDAPECFYCPSHEGRTVLNRVQWESRRDTLIETHYHYCGHVQWTNINRPRLLSEGDRLVLVVDAIPAVDDLNHAGIGLNSLRGDGSVRWHDQGGEQIARPPARRRGRPR